MFGYHCALAAVLAVLVLPPSATAFGPSPPPRCAKVTPEENLVNLFTRAIQTRNPAPFDGLLSDDFRGFVGGWGPTTCVTYDKPGFIAHVADWQSTWARNYTLFDVRHKVQSHNSIALVLTIAYYSKDGMPGGSVNADEVLQFFWTNEDATQITGFLELSGLVQPDNAKQMIDQSWTPYVDGVNNKNLSAIANSLSTDVKFTFYQAGGKFTANKNSVVEQYEEDFKARENDNAMFSLNSGAACKSYTWGYANEFDIQESKTQISFLVAYNRLNDDGQIVEGGAWVKSGLPSFQ
jgi:hypothetical protein